MFDWEFKKSDNVKPHTLFERLLQEFLRSKFKDFSWELTKNSNDNNRDVLGTCKKEGTKHWAEAKFIYDEKNKNISSRRFDSTLISALLSTDEIVAVHFGTNISFPKSFIQRSLQYNSCIAIEDTYYINKESLERWLYEHPEIANKYFKKPIDISMLGNSRVEIEELIFLKRSDLYKFEVIDLDSISKITSYEVKIIVHSYNISRQKIKLFINNKALLEEKELFLESGVQIFSFCNGSFLEEEENLVQIKDLGGKLLAEKKLNLKYTQYQFTYGQTSFINNFVNKTNIYKVWNLFGKSGTGKTWILDILGTSYGMQKKIVSLDFCGNTQDIKQLIYFLWNLENIKGVGEESKTEFYKLLQGMIDNQAFEQAYNLLEEGYSENHIFPKILNKQMIFIFKNTSKTNEKFYKNMLLPIFNYLIMLDQTIIIESEKKLDLINEGLLSTEKQVNTQKLTMLTTQEIQDVFFQNLDILDEKEKYLAAINLNNSIHSLESISEYKILLENAKNFDEVISVIEKIKAEKYLSKDDMALLLAIKILTNLMEVQFENFSELHHSSLKNLLKQKYIYKKDNNIYVNKKVPSNSNLIKKQITILYEFYKQTNDIHIAYKIVELDESAWNYLKEPILTESNRLYNLNYYSDAAKGYKLFIDFIKKDHDRIGVYEIDMIYNYSECLNHTVSAEKSFEQLNFALPLAKEKGNQEQVLYIEGELLSISYWRFTDSYRLLNEILRFIDDVEKYKTTNRLTSKVKRGYETAHNRYMVTTLLNDNFEEATEWMDRNIRLSNVHNEERHKGYTLMDYAKGTYHKKENWIEALKLLEQAYTIFDKEKENELRRKLDCQCEISYVKCLLDETLDMKYFSNNKEYLRDCGFFTQFYKAELKEIFLYAYRNIKIDDMINKIEKLEKSNKISPSPRTKYLIHHVKSILFFRKGDLTKVKALAEECLETLPASGYNSYHLINKNNLDLLNNECLFDFRIW